MTTQRDTTSQREQGLNLHLISALQHLKQSIKEEPSLDYSY